MVSLVVFTGCRQADILQVKLIAQVYKPNLCLKLAVPSVSSMMCFAVGVGLASMTLLGGGLSSVVAQVPSVGDRKLLDETTMSQVNVLFVNPSVGDDTAGNGGERTPLKTITQALRLATGNTVIMLSPGTYSVETGEVFPLLLKPGISIQGDIANKGRGIIIQGGGEYLSRSYGGQNVTIIGATQGGLAGVTVTNSHPRGYGLWIESSNPVIRDNTFTGNTQDGISIAGNSTTTISQNYFYRNGANGITIGGNSQPQVRENIFQETGFGINITQNAAPVLVSNQIQNNRSGILVQANARPILRNNLIQDSKEDGLVAIAQAMPDLGNVNEAGGNEFRNNARYDINATAAKQIIAAGGNILASNRTAGKVDINAQLPNTQPATQPNNVISQIPPNGEITFTVNSQPSPVISQPSPVISQPSSVISQPSSVNNQLVPLQPATTPLTTPTSKVSDFPVPSILTVRETPTNTSGKITTLPVLQPDTQQLNYVHINPNTIEFVAPQQPANSTAIAPIPETTPQSDAAILLVPDSNIPLSDTRNMPKVPASPTSTTAYSSSSRPPARSKEIGVRYRVVVETATDREQDLVRTFAPGAFPTIWQGRRVMQAGVFSNRYNADEMLKKLNSNGLRTIIEPLN